MQFELTDGCPGHDSLDQKCSEISGGLLKMTNSNFCPVSVLHWPVPLHMSPRSGHLTIRPCPIFFKFWIISSLESRDACPEENRLPREIDKNRGAQRGKTYCRFHWRPLFITTTNYALEEERVRKSFHLNLCSDCDYLVHRNTFLKWKDELFSVIKTS